MSGDRAADRLVVLDTETLVNRNGWIRDVVRNYGVTLVIAAATAGFAAHINSSVTNINSNIRNIDQRVSTIQTTVFAQDTTIAGSIAALQDTLKSVSAVTQKIKASQNLCESRYDTLLGLVEVLSGEFDTLRTRIVTLQDSLRGLSGSIGAVNDSLANNAIKLEESVDNLRDSIEAVSIRFVKKADSLQDFVRETRKQNDELHSVRIKVGAEKSLVESGNLRTYGFLCLKKYEIRQFPDTNDSKIIEDGAFIDSSDVFKVRVGSSFRVKAEVATLCGFYGSLRKGKDYVVSEEQSDTARVTFTASTIAGQRILVVLK